MIAPNVQRAVDAKRRRYEYLVPAAS